MAARGSARGRRNLQIVIVVDMAGRARHVGVSERQRKAGRVVVKLRIKPGVKRVASFARRGKIRAGMIWIGCFLKILQMA